MSVRSKFDEAFGQLERFKGTLIDDISHFASSHRPWSSPRSDIPLRVPVVGTPICKTTPPPRQRVDREKLKSADDVASSMPPPSPLPAKVPLSNCSTSVQNKQHVIDSRFLSPTSKRSRHHAAGSGLETRLPLQASRAVEPVLGGGALRVKTPTKRTHAGSRVSLDGRRKTRTRGSSVSSRGSMGSARSRENSLADDGGRVARGTGSAGKVPDAIVLGSAAAGDRKSTEPKRNGGIEALAVGARYPPSASRSVRTCTTASETSSSEKDTLLTGGAFEGAGAAGGVTPPATEATVLDRTGILERTARRVSARHSGDSCVGLPPGKSRVEAENMTDRSPPLGGGNAPGGVFYGGSGGGSNGGIIIQHPLVCRPKRSSPGKGARRSSVFALRGSGACEVCGESEATTAGVENNGRFLCEDCAAEAELPMEHRSLEVSARRSTMASMRSSRHSAASSGISRGRPSDAGTLSRDPSRQPARDDFEGGKALGKGKFGNVYLVKFRSSGVTVALKVLFKGSVLSDGMRHNVQREAEIQSRLRHENIVRLMGFFQDPTKIYFVLEYAPGGDVFKVLRQHRKGLPEETAARYLSGALRAVAYLHQHHVIHRDIKPENLLLDAAGRVKLSDFGWSVPAVPPRYHVRSTLCGTPEYVAPEMLAEEPRYTDAVDVWSLGVLCFELLTGVTPFRDRGMRSPDPLPENDGSVQETPEVRPGDVNAELYGRIVGWNGSPEGLFREGAPGASVSEAARHVVSRLMKPRASERIRAEEALRLPWLEDMGRGSSVV